MQGFDISEAGRISAGRALLDAGAFASNFDAITAELESGSDYQLLRVVKQADRHHALFRLSSPRGLNYHIVEMGMNEDGKIVARDFYAVLGSEPFSALVRKFILPSFSDHSDVAKELARPDREYSVVAFKPLTDALQRGELQKVLELYEQLPPNVQKTKTVLALRLNCASRLQDVKQMETAAAEFRRHHPEEIAPDLMTYVMFFNANQHELALASIDRIDHFVGGDPYLDMIRALVARSENDLDQAQQLLVSAVETHLTPAQVHEELIDLTLHRKQFDLTLKYLLELEQRFELEIADLSEIPTYAEFIKSPQYQQWQKRDKQ